MLPNFRSVFRLRNGLRPEYLDQARDSLDAPEHIPAGCAGSHVFVPSSTIGRGLAFNPSGWPEDYFEGSDRITFTKPY